MVLLHDPFWAPRAVAARGRRPRRAGPPRLAATRRRRAARAGALYRPALGAWLRRAYARADAVMAACDPRADTGRAATLPLRFGLDPAFYPDGDEPRGDHVLYAGRLSREKGVFALLEAAARSREPWPLWLVGAGAAGGAVAARVRRLGLARRVRILPHERDREALAARLPPRALRGHARRARDVRPRRLSRRRRAAPPRRLRDRAVGARARPARRTRSRPATRTACWPRSSAPARPSPTASRPRASPPPTAGSARSPPSSPTWKRWSRDDRADAPQPRRRARARGRAPRRRARRRSSAAR